MVIPLENMVPLNEGNAIYRLIDLMKKGYAIGFITAFRGDSDLSENRKRNERLKDMITKLGFGYRLLEGHYVENGTREVTEETFVVNAKEEDWRNLAIFLQSACIEFNQESTILAVNDTAYLLTPSTVLDDFPHTAKPLGMLHYNPSVLGTCYSALKGQGFRFGDAILESHEARIGFTHIGGQLLYDLARKQLREEGINFCHFIMESYRNACTIEELK